MTTAPGRLPNFLLVGAAKAGTTALFEWLRAHPQIYMPRNKELSFFVGANWQRGPAWYASRFAGSGSAIAVGEATPYMSFKSAPERMASVVPEARLIAVLRNPVDRAWSHYWFMVNHKVERRSFEEAIVAEKRGDPSAVPYLASGMYLPQIERLTEHFARERLLVMLFDDLKRDPTSCFEQVTDFLDLESSVPANVGQAYNKPFRLRSLQLYKAQLRHQERLHIPWVVGAAVHRLNSKPVAYPPLPSALRAELAAMFDPGNHALGNWLGRELDGWST